jgi:hypothetical protein
VKDNNEYSPGGICEEKTVCCKTAERSNSFAEGIGLNHLQVWSFRLAFWLCSSLLDN